MDFKLYDVIIIPILFYKLYYLYYLYYLSTVNK